MSGNERSSLSNWNLSGSKDNADKSRARFNRFSSIGSFKTMMSFNSSTENSSAFKRKLDETDYSTEGKKRKEVSESSASSNFVPLSPWEFRRLRADLIEAQAQIVKLEDRIDELHKKNKETVIFFDKEKNEMKLQLESNRNTVKDLEYRLHKVRKREAEAQEEFNERKKLYETEKENLNRKILQLQQESGEFKFKFDELTSGSEESIRNLENEVRHLSEDNERLKLDLEEKEELCQSLNERLSAAVEKANDAEETLEELQALKLKCQELESEKAEYEEARKVTIALSDKVLSLNEIEKELIAKRQEVVNLRQSVHNKVLLEELVHDLKGKLAVTEEREKQLPLLKARLTELEIELKKWVALASDYSNESTIESLRNYIENLQEKELATSIEISNLKADIRSSENKVSAVQNELENVKQINEKLENMLQKLKVEVQVLRKKSILVTRERDSYRQQLDSYEKDLTMTSLTSENLSNEICSQMKDRIRNLEESLEDYRKHVEVLETQLKECQGEDQTDNVTVIQKLKEEIRNLEESNKFLSRIRDELENKLETKALKGEYLSPNVKVLHFRDNPVAEAQRKQLEDMKNLKEECDRLRTRVQLLESGEVMDITQKVGENIKFLSSERIKELEKELESANIKIQRLKEGYRKTSQEFCDVSYMLLGYRISLVSNNKLYKLYNMYSNSPSDYLMFQLTKHGTMEMLGTPFAQSLSKLIDQHLYKNNSIPAFLAAVTLSLYEATDQSDDDGDDGDDGDDEDGETEEPPEEIELD